MEKRYKNLNQDIVQVYMDGFIQGRYMYNFQEMYMYNLEDLKKIYPNITDKMIQDFPIMDEDEFYQKYQKVFESSSIHEGIEEEAKMAVKRKAPVWPYDLNHYIADHFDLDNRFTTIPAPGHNTEIWFNLTDGTKILISIDRAKDAYKVFSGTYEKMCSLDEVTKTIFQILELAIAEHYNVGSISYQRPDVQ